MHKMKEYIYVTMIFAILLSYSTSQLFSQTNINNKTRKYNKLVIERLELKDNTQKNAFFELRIPRKLIVILKEEYSDVFDTVITSPRSYVLDSLESNNILIFSGSLNSRIIPKSLFLDAKLEIECNFKVKEPYSDKVIVSDSVTVKSYSHEKIVKNMASEILNKIIPIIKKSF